MTSKRPTSQPVHEIQFRTGNDNLAEGAFDLGGPLSDDGHLLYRLNGIARSQNSRSRIIKRRASPLRRR